MMRKEEGVVWYYRWAGVLTQMEEAVKQGWMVFQKCTCAGCSEPLEALEPNKFEPMMKCPVCHMVTDCRIVGANYLVMMPRVKPLVEFTEEKANASN